MGTTLLTVKDIEKHANRMRYLNEIKALYEKNINILQSKSIQIEGIIFSDHGDSETMNINYHFPIPPELLINGFKEALRVCKKEYSEHVVWLMTNRISTIVED